MPASQPTPADHQAAGHTHSPDRFDYLRAIAHFEGAWKWCARAECNRRRKCCGGPRGTATRRGIPACRTGEPGEAWAAEQIAQLAQSCEEGGPR